MRTTDHVQLADRSAEGATGCVRSRYFNALKRTLFELRTDVKKRKGFQSTGDEPFATAT